LGRKKLGFAGEKRKGRKKGNGRNSKRARIEIWGGRKKKRKGLANVVPKLFVNDLRGSKGGVGLKLGLLKDTGKSLEGRRGPGGGEF